MGEKKSRAEELRDLPAEDDQDWIEETTCSFPDGHWKPVPFFEKCKNMIPKRNGPLNVHPEIFKRY